MSQPATLQAPAGHHCSRGHADRPRPTDSPMPPEGSCERCPLRDRPWSRSLLSHKHFYGLASRRPLCGKKVQKSRGSTRVEGEHSVAPPNKSSKTRIYKMIHVEIGN